MKKILKLILIIFAFIIFYVVVDIFSIYTRSKPLFPVKGTLPNMYVGIFYDTYNCAEYAVPQVKLKGTKFTCLEKINVEKVTEKLVMVDGILYYSKGSVSTVDGRCGNMDGEITSTVSSSSEPNINDQSNFGIGFGYQYINDTIEVLINGEWIVFERR